VFRKSNSIYFLALAKIYLFCTVYLIIYLVSTYNWLELPVGSLVSSKTPQSVI
jgi:hypothetical protein